MRLENAISRFAKGEIIIVTDHHERENEGDLIFAAQFVTPEKINFLTKFGRGLICATITEQHASQLQLARQEVRNSNRLTCAFTTSIDASNLTTSGISASDRCQTIAALAKQEAKVQDFATPGHVFPVIAHPNGLVAREGHTEASIELCVRAKLFPAAVICEILAEDGSSASSLYLNKLAEEHNLPIISVAELVESLI